jgi:Sulfotransferase family
VRVLYIAGTGRSGSTLLASILGQVKGIFNAGEIRYIWERGLVENRLCGCGKRFRDCDFWQGILSEAVGPDAPDAQGMIRLQSSLTRVRHLPSLVLKRDHAGAGFDAYSSVIVRLYRAISKAARSEVIVDSSKLPSYGRLLAAMPEIDLHVVQLVRDPRSAATSWARVKEQPDRGVPGSMERMSPLRSALLWDLWNSTTRQFLKPRSTRFMRLRYEDFVAEPRESVRRVVQMLGMGDAELPFSDASTVMLAPNHTVAGNPDRLRSGPVVIRRDAGTSRLGRRDQAIVTGLTVPLLLRFGYPVLTAGGGQPDRIGIQHLPGPLRTLRRLQRHWRWGRQEGFGRLVEEDQLDPRARLAGSMRRRDWRRRHPITPGSTAPVFLVGLQRSGTNMVARALEANPEFEVRNENDGAAFDRFQLRPLPVVRDLVMRSGQRFLVLKPLIDSHRVDELLSGLGTPSPGRALWTYRNVDGRVRSALSKFGDQNLQVVRAIAEGRGDGLWQAQRLSDKARKLIRGLDLDNVTTETASAVIWYVRNSLYFEIGLDRRDDCLLVSYDRLLEDPERDVRRICEFLDTEFQPAMAAGIARRSPNTRGELAIDPEVRQRCSELERRLEEACLVAAAG